MTTATAFEAAAEEDLAPLFDPKAVRDLITPKLIARYQALVASWTDEEDNSPAILLATTRLRAVLDAGWDGEATLEAIATDVTAHVPDYEPSVSSNEVLASIIGLFEGAEGNPAIDAFAAALLERAQTDSSLAIIALRLPVTDAALAQLKASLEGHLTTSYDADDLNRIGDESASALTRLGIDVLQHGRARWISTGDQSFLEMIMDRGKGGDACFNALDAQPASAAAMDRAVQLAAAAHTRRRNGLLKRVAVKAGSTLANLPSSALATYLEAFTSASHGLESATDQAVSMSLAHGIRVPIQSAPDAAAIEHFVAAGKAIGSSGAERELAVAIAERANAVPVSGITADSIEWLIRRSRRAAATSLLRREIEAGTQLAALVNVARAERSHLSSERQIRSAFVSAAAQLSARGPGYGAADQVVAPLRLVAEWTGSDALGSDELASVEAIANGPFADDDQVKEVVGRLRGSR